MARVIYSERQVEEFIELAQMKGIGPAVRELGYPSTPMAYKWFRDRGEDIPSIDSLATRAVHFKLFYGDNEKKFAAQKNIERIVEALEEADLDAKDINLLSNALHKAVQTFNLIDGKATNVTESVTKDGTDLAITDMLNAAKAKNALKEEELNDLDISS